ncbi:MAG TPA: GNAT family N-acetyltransferase [Phenylobacterium sp.]|uniref:GNAT family N-acetyltransferase n=1 Tax=Phenylobacterium sp. TaxID=1871053 RepID=UPI002B45BB13|nr:GNAT family N-acetyltransferase [Phenylobacterium sp.]HKR86612.1 GNAT family N-acetyltransferase [Phenylobacterium sp.]
MKLAEVSLAWATLEDAPAMAAVHAEAFAAAWDAAAFAELMAGPGVFGILAGEAADLGVVLCRLAAGELEVLTIGVSPAARRRGVARALMAAALGAARQAGAGTAFLEVAVDNAEAAALYAGLGFRRVGLRRNYYDRGAAGRADALVMRLDLADA